MVAPARSSNCVVACRSARVMPSAGSVISAEPPPEMTQKIRSRGVASRSSRGEIARGVHRILIGHRMTRFVHADVIGQRSIDVLIFGDDDAAAQAIAQHFAHGVGHRHGGLACAHQPDPIELAQSVGSIGHQDLIADARNEFVHGFSRIDGRQCGLLKLTRYRAQIKIGHGHFRGDHGFPGFTAATAARAASAGVARPASTSSMALRRTGPTAFRTAAGGGGCARAS